MRVLVLGGGGREHAIVWKLAQSPRAPELFQASANRVAHGLGQHVSIDPDDPAPVVEFVERNAIDLAIVGPDALLQAGVTDALRERGHAVLGPSRAAARVEWSKTFAKRVMAQAGVPTAPSETFTDSAAAKRYVRKRGAPIVVKADGLAAGKGVTVAATVDEALAAIDAAMTARVFGDAGASVVIEDCLEGEEVSVFCFTRRRERIAPHRRARLQARLRRRPGLQHRRHGRLQSPRPTGTPPWSGASARRASSRCSANSPRWERPSQACSSAA